MSALRSLAIVALLAATVPGAGAGRDLAPRAVAPTAYFAVHPDVAYAGDRFLSVWTEEMGALGSPVKGAFLDSAGRRISSEAFTILDRRLTWKQLVAAGDRFALFWRGTEATTYLTWIDRDGRVSEARPLDLPASGSANVAWNASRFLVALWGPAYQQSTPSGVLLDGDGNVLRENIPTIDWARTIEPAGDGFMLFSTWPKLTVQRVTADGQASVPIDLGAVISEPAPPVASARADGSVLAVWSSPDRSAGPVLLVAAVIAADGSIARAPHVIQTSETTLRLHHLLPTPEGALLVASKATDMQNERLETMMLDPGGTLIATPLQGGPVAGQIATADSGSVVVVTGSIDQPWSLRVGSVAIDATGHVGPRQDVSVVPARQTLPLLSAGAWRLLAFWTDREGDAAWLRTASIAPDGEVAQRSTVGTGFTASVDVAWNGSTYLAAQLEAGLLHGIRLDADGNRIDGLPIVLSPRILQPWQRSNAHVVWSGTSWLVASGGDESMLMTTVSASGIAGPARTLDILGTPPEYWFAAGTPVALAFDGQRALFVWRESHSSGCVFPICPEPIEMMRAHLLDAAGSPVGEAIDLPMLGVSHDVAIATSGSEFLLIGDDAGVVVTRSGDSLQVAHSGPLRGVGDLFWDGVSYVHAYRSRFVQALEIARYGRALEPIGNPRYVPALTSDSDAGNRVSVAGLAGRPAVIATSEGTAESGARARMYSEAEFGALPEPPEMPRNVRTRRLDDGRYLTTWDPPISGVFDLYRYEERTKTGELRQLGFLPPGVHSWIGTQPFVQVRTLNAYGLSGVAARRRAVAR